MKRTVTAAVMLTAAVLCACRGGVSGEPVHANEGKEPAVSVAEPTHTPDTVVFAVMPSATPAPLTPSPVPTPSPTPTPEPDPYTAGTEKTVYREGFYHVPLNDALKARISGLSYPADPSKCSVRHEELRYLRILYTDFEGAERTGELIVHEKVADEVLEIFAALYDARYPLTSVRLVDDFGEPGDDTKSMEADNTSSFCYRHVTGSKKLSRHSYGAAIDINPRENPYIRPDGSVSPANAKPYVNRKNDFPGKIDRDDLCYKTFKAHGWEWGGDFKGNKDYQHFSKDIKR
ncbi:MAG: M15 family metallopeptidase [Clostridia bacterium]|nr:M15 family metallopeptidase [Clostridia bacterium]